jgi:putative endonuclease
MKNYPIPIRPAVRRNINFVYILECADTSLYVGCTNDLDRRLDQHNTSKRGAHYTKIRRPVVLMHVEKFSTLKEARRREAELKSWRREKKIALIESSRES